jgi:hypothetical protein
VYVHGKCSLDKLAAALDILTVVHSGPVALPALLLLRALDEFDEKLRMRKDLCSASLHQHHIKHPRTSPRTSHRTKARAQDRNDER